GAQDNIQNVDAVVQVWRCFGDSDVVIVDGEVNPVRAIETIEIELAMSDLESVERRHTRFVKQSRSGDKKAAFHRDVSPQLLT
ncbi:MAG: redox-regulated ATPase YchF, partial [Candidatus Poseidoniia archaeon]